MALEERYRKFLDGGDADRRNIIDGLDEGGCRPTCCCTKRRHVSGFGILESIMAIVAFLYGLQPQRQQEKGLSI
jgi:hypothetical protein